MSLDKLNGEPEDLSGDYDHSIYAETYARPTQSTPQKQTVKEPAKREKLRKIVEELTELKEKALAAVEPAPEQERVAAAAPQAVYSAPSETIMAEIARLREENMRTQTQQEVSQQLSRFRDEIAREVLAKNAPVPYGVADNPLAFELRRLTDRLDRIERGADEPRREDTRTAPCAEPADKYAFKSADEVNAKLARIDRQLGELSVLAIANDVSPLAVDIASVREELSNCIKTAQDAVIASIGAQPSVIVTQDEDGKPVHTVIASDKVLDELIALQTSVDDIKHFLEGLGAPVEAFETETHGVQEVMFGGAQAFDKLSENAQAIDRLAEEVMLIGEQIVSINNDLKIYADSINGDTAQGDTVLSVIQSLKKELTEARLGASPEAFTKIHDQIDILGNHLSAAESDRVEMIGKLDALQDAVSALKSGGVKTESAEETVVEFDAQAELISRLDRLQKDITGVAAQYTAEADELKVAVESLGERFDERAAVVSVSEETAPQTHENVVLEALAEVRYQLAKLSDSAALSAGSAQSVSGAEAELLEKLQESEARRQKEHAESLSLLRELFYLQRDTDTELALLRAEIESLKQNEDAITPVMDESPMVVAEETQAEDSGSPQAEAVQTEDTKAEDVQALSQSEELVRETTDSETADADVSAVAVEAETKKAAREDDDEEKRLLMASLSALKDDLTSLNLVPADTVSPQKVVVISSKNPNADVVRLPDAIAAQIADKVIYEQMIALQERNALSKSRGNRLKRALSKSVVAEETSDPHYCDNFAALHALSERVE